MRLFVVCFLFCFLVGFSCGEPQSSSDEDKTIYYNAALALEKVALQKTIDKNGIKVMEIKQGNPELVPAPLPGTILKIYNPTEQIETEFNVRSLIDEKSKGEEIAKIELEIAGLRITKTAVSVLIGSEFADRKSVIDKALKSGDEGVSITENMQSELDINAARVIAIKMLSPNIPPASFEDAVNQKREALAPDWLIQSGMAIYARYYFKDVLAKQRSEREQFRTILPGFINQVEQTAENMYTLTHLFGGSMDPKPTVIESVPDKTEMLGEEISIEETEVPTIVPTPIPTPLSTCPDGGQIENGACYRPQEDCSKYFNHHWEGGYFYEGAYGVCMCDGRVTNCNN